LTSVLELQISPVNQSNKENMRADRGRPSVASCLPYE
jgi:hypothetical protein